MQADTDTQQAHRLVATGKRRAEQQPVAVFLFPAGKKKGLIN
jgi:hypothetical protein